MKKPKKIEFSPERGDPDMGYEEDAMTKNSYSEILKAQGRVPAGSRKGGQFAGSKGGAGGSGGSSASGGKAEYQAAKDLPKDHVPKKGGRYIDSFGNRATVSGLSSNGKTVHYDTAGGTPRQLGLKDFVATMRQPAQVKKSYDFVEVEVPIEEADEVSIDVQVKKVHEDLGVVIGYAIVCKVRGEDGKLAEYFDLQDEAVVEDGVVEAALEFAMAGGHGKVMHKGEAFPGAFPFVFPLTEEIAKALDIDPQKTGLLVGMKPPPEVLAKFKSGEFSGFSIGGTRIKSEEVSED